MGKGGLPPLSEIIKKYNPQMALYMLGTNDINGGRTVAAYIADVEKALDMLMDNGTIPILSTLPPIRGKTAQVDEFCKALRELAAKKKIPLLDLNAEMKARAGEQMESAYLGGDGVHLSFPNAGGPASDENLKHSGYLLRCYMAVYKGMEVKAKVIDSAEAFDKIDAGLQFAISIPAASLNDYSRQDAETQRRKGKHL